MTTPRSERHLYNVGVNYQKADTHLRALFSLSKEQQHQLLALAKERGLSACMVLSTCNRTEIMGFAHHPYELISLLLKVCQCELEIFLSVSSIHKGEQAVEHLFKTACGLNSQILGDHEIIGQLKSAFALAKSHQLINSSLSRLFDYALQASKEVKYTTDFSKGTTSVAFAAVSVIQKYAPDDAKILVYGLGAMGYKICDYLRKMGKNITVINRSFDKALALSKQFPQITIAPLSALSEVAKVSEVIVVATGAKEPTLLKEHVNAHKPLMIIDLAIPENVADEVQYLAPITYYNVDHISLHLATTADHRRAQIPKVTSIIARYQEEFWQWYAERSLSPLIFSFKEELLKIQEKELAFLQKGDLKCHDALFTFEQMQGLGNRMVQKTMAEFVKFLKQHHVSS